MQNKYFLFWLSSKPRAQEALFSPAPPENWTKSPKGKSLQLFSRIPHRIRPAHTGEIQVPWIHSIVGSLDGCADRLSIFIPQIDGEKIGVISLPQRPCRPGFVITCTDRLNNLLRRRRLNAGQRQIQLGQGLGQPVERIPSSSAGAMAPRSNRTDSAPGLVGLSPS